MAMEMLKSQFEDWHPRSAEHLSLDDHLDKMSSVGKKGGNLYCNPVVTGVSGILIWGFVVWACIAKEDMAEDTSVAQTWVTDVWNWLYMLSQNIWILALLWLLFTHFDMKLGKDDEEPEFSDLTYFAMLFSCGVATGLWYYSAEVMWHYEGYGTPRWTDQYMYNDNTRAEHAMMVTWFHWGLHGWIPYVVVGALISILSYRRGFPMSMRFTMYPIIGELVYGKLGDMIEATLPRTSWTFVVNFELSSLVSVLAPFIYAGQVANKVWGGSLVTYTLGFASLWVTTIVFFCLAAADEAFLSLAAAAYFVFAFAVGGMRTAARAKLGITGDMINDAMAGLFAYPCAIGQMAREDFSSSLKSMLKSQDEASP